MQITKYTNILKLNINEARTGSNIEQSQPAEHLPNKRTQALIDRVPNMRVSSSEFRSEILSDPLTGPLLNSSQLKSYSRGLPLKTFKELNEKLQKSFEYAEKGDVENSETTMQSYIEMINNQPDANLSHNAKIRIIDSIKQTVEGIRRQFFLNLN